MFFNCRNGQRHLFRYLRHRFFLNAPQNEDTTALIGKILEDALHAPQLIAGAKLRFDILP
ncbi:hypothetical protein BH10PSE15_BH10PSE15_01900 [soil metagenome]